METGVRQRTRLYPANESEEAVEAVLRSLRSATGAARDVLLARGGTAPELAELGEDISAAAKGIAERWRLLDRESPYRTAALEEAVDLLSRLLDTATPLGDRAVASLGLDAELSVVVVAQARQVLSDRLHSARGSRSIRSLATSAGLSIGYLSDLEAGRSGPPSADVSEKLAAELQIDLADVDEARERADQLKRTHRERSARSRRRAAPGGTLPREDARLRAIAAAAAEDPGLLDLIDATCQLPRSARRSLARFLVEVLPAPGTGPVEGAAFRP